MDLTGSAAYLNKTDTVTGNAVEGNNSICLSSNNTLPKDGPIPLLDNSSLLFGSDDDISYNNTFVSLMNPLRFSDQARVFIIVLYSVTTLLALLGNLVVVVTLAAGTSFWKLRHFLINLAVSDLLISTFCLPFTFTPVIFGNWHFGDFMCPFVMFMQHLSVSVCAFTNVAIGLDRYWAVVRPMLARLPTARVQLVIAIVWLFGVAISAPQLFVSRQVFRYHSGYQCVQVWGNQGSEKSNRELIYLAAVLIITYLVPFIILTLTYSTVGLRLWERTHPGEAYSLRDQRQRESKKKVIKMLLTIVIAFGFCWLPLHLFHVLTVARPDLHEHQSEEMEHLFLGTFLACHWLSMAHSCVNPIIYGFLHEKFRKDVRMLLRTCLRCGFCVRQAFQRSVSRGFHVPTDTNDTTDRGSPFRVSRRVRSSSTNSSNRSRTGTFSLGCGLRRQDTVEDNQNSLPHPKVTKCPPNTSVTCRCSNTCHCGVSTV